MTVAPSQYLLLIACDTLHKSWFSRTCIVAGNFKLAERKYDHRHRAIKKGNYYPLYLFFCYTREQVREKQAWEKTYIFTRNTHSSTTSTENI